MRTASLAGHGSAPHSGVFEPRDIFLDFIETRTGEVGADLGPWLAQPFEVLDTPEDERPATLDEDVASPVIFGALFQSVMDPVERRAQGAHYTTEKNILKVIEPLFMDDLRAKFERVRERRGRGHLAALRQFQAKLRALTFFDPACGCGNFLIIAYRELRMLEIEVIREIVSGEQVLDTEWGDGLGGRGPVLRNRAWRVPGPHRGDRAVDDGPHHEQPSEP